MMKPRVYVETSVVSYLTARSARDMVIAGRQQSAISAMHRVPFLLTWNFRHIANAAARPRIEAVCRDGGIDPPLLCTPEQLVVAEDDDGT